MGHDIYWDNEDKSVLFHQYISPASKDDFYQLAQKSAAILEKVEYTVHLIIDDQPINLVYDSADIAFMDKIRPANEGAVVVIVSPFKIKYKAAIQDLGRRIGQKTFRNAYSVETLEQARQFLQDEFKVRYP
jgi:hypothetical protein